MGKQRFWILAEVSLLLVPLIASLLIIVLFTVPGVGVDSQVFSDIGAAFIAYAMISIVIWGLGDIPEGFDHTEHFRWRLLFIVMCGLLIVVRALIIVGGIDIGLFLNAGDSTSNGIAHFGGFPTLLILFLLYDVCTEKSIYSQMTSEMAAGMGICGMEIICLP